MSTNWFRSLVLSWVFWTETQYLQPFEPFNFVSSSISKSFGICFYQEKYMAIQHFVLCQGPVLVQLSDTISSWWRHQMETFSALLVIIQRNSPLPGEFPAQRPVTRSFHVSFDLRLNKPLSKQSWSWWFETLSPPLWRHCYEPLPNATTAIK